MAATILIVDDSMMIRTQVSRTLAGAGFTVVQASDGVLALQALVATARVDLVVCDVNMPNMDGMDLLAKMREEARFATLPVVMLTTEARPELMQRAKALGAKGWVLKPFKAETLVAVAQKLTAAA
jgi:two-component system, chemotaxis family, chemotaxis protein CheY